MAGAPAEVKASNDASARSVERVASVKDSIEKLHKRRLPNNMGGFKIGFECEALSHAVSDRDEYFTITIAIWQ